MALIDIGAAATGRADHIALGYTCISLDNPANDSGTITSIEVWCETNITGFIVGTFYFVSGDDYKCRDSEAISGTISSGSKQTFTGKTITVVTDDLIGCYWTGGWLEEDYTGFAGLYTLDEEQIDPNDQATYNLSVDDAMSCYGTGLTAQTAPAVSTQAASSIEDTTATGNGNITDTGNGTCDIRGFVWDLASQGAPGNVAPGVSGYANDVPENDGFGTGAFTGSLTGLPTGDTIYVRAYVHNTWGYAYGGEVSFLTKPAAATNVAATDGTHPDKVTVTWTKSTGATGYKVYEGVNLLDTLGDVATYDDTAAAAGTIDNAGTAAATDGGTSYVALSLASESIANGASRTYKVVAFNATGDADDSGTDTGYRTPSAITYQWQISAADSDADYSNISGATTDPYNHTVAHTDGRYYKCVCSSTGASNSPTTSTVDRGWRKHLPVTDGDLIGVAIIRKS